MLTAWPARRNWPPTVGLALVCTGLLVACGGASPKESSTTTPTGPTSAAPSGAVLVRAAEPPANPPVMTINEIDVPVLSYEWWSRAKNTMARHYPSDGFRLDSLPRISVPRSPITLAIAASAQPERVELKLFDSVSGDHPAGERHSVVCTQLCGSILAGNAVTLQVDIPPTAKIAVLMFFWGVPLDPAHPLEPVAAYDYASYAFRT